jgi:hypothetical protein
METDQPLRRPNYPIPEEFHLLGKEGMKRFVIAVKVQGELWPPRFLAQIHRARRLFDEGSHIMVQGKHSDGWVIQYLIPRKRPLRNPRTFFVRSI